MGGAGLGSFYSKLNLSFRWNSREEKKKKTIVSNLATSNSWYTMSGGPLGMLETLFVLYRMPLLALIFGSAAVNSSAHTVVIGGGGGGHSLSSSFIWKTFFVFQRIQGIL